MASFYSEDRQSFVQSLPSVISPLPTWVPPLSRYPSNPIDPLQFQNQVHEGRLTLVEKSFSNQKVASSIPCRSVLEQDTEPLIAPDVQCAISVNVKCVYILVS